MTKFGDDGHERRIAEWEWEREKRSGVRCRNAGGAWLCGRNAWIAKFVCAYV